MASVRSAVPLVLTITGGFVDTASFLGLQGLFAAHVTGNFVTIGASLVHGTSGALSKLLALPMFCIVIVVARAATHRLHAGGWPVLRAMLSVKVALLLAAAWLAIRFGPFSDPDASMALGVGLLLVAAMAIQNAVHRIHLASSPPSTLMTGTTTQIMIDLADLLGHVERDSRRVVEDRLSRMAMAVLAFAAGCAGAALMFSRVGMYCFVVPPILGLVSLSLAPAQTAAA